MIASGRTIYKKNLLLNWNLVNSILMATAFKLSREILVHDSLGCLCVDKTTRHNEHVCIVVLTGKMSDFWNPTQCRTDSLMLVKSDGNALSTTADGDARIALTALNCLCQRMSKIGIVATVG